MSHESEVTERPRRKARRRAGLFLCLALLAGLATLDGRRPAEDRLGVRAAVGVIELYQTFLSPLNKKTGNRCRFHPSCSNYAQLAIKKHGLLGGSGRAAWRIVRCGPWSERGTVDFP